MSLGTLLRCPVGEADVIRAEPPGGGCGGTGPRGRVSEVTGGRPLRPPRGTHRSGVRALSGLRASPMCACVRMGVPLCAWPTNPSKPAAARGIITNPSQDCRWPRPGHKAFEGSSKALYKRRRILFHRTDGPMPDYNFKGKRHHLS